MSVLSEFELSRIYAEGWNAASKLSTEESLDFDVDRIAQSNPYKSGQEQQRWQEGFFNALGKAPTDGGR